MSEKKQIWAIFLSKISCKAAETTRNINNAFGPGIVNECTTQWWFKKFYKGDKSLEDEECSGWPAEVDNNQLWAITKADALTTTLEVAVELNIKHSTVVWHLKQIGKVKKLNTWVPPEQTEKPKKKKMLWNVIFFYSMQLQQTISWLDCDMWRKVDFIWQPSMTNLVFGLRRNSKVLPKAKFAPKKKKKVCGGVSCSLVVFCWSDPLQLSESWWNHYIWEVCLANQWDAWKTACLQPGLVNRKSPWPISFLWQYSTTCYTTKTSKLERIGL